ncbi:MAG: nodulation protein NodH [Paracoccaceae bacterium]
MFAEMRTGSNFLEANLNLLPGVTCHGELFNPHFIGRKDQLSLFGMGIEARQADPLRFWTSVRAETQGLAGFRYFHDHDARIFGPMVDDARCAKIILTRNPLDSYVSWKIARATGQWKLTHVKNLKTARIRFDAAEFAAQLEAQRHFQTGLAHRLQVTGQTAFRVDYDDLQDLEVLNGLAAFLGTEARLASVDGTLKKQNPETLAEKVENPEEMEAALSRLDPFDLARTPWFEQRRPAAIPSFLAAGGLLCLPIRSGPEAQLSGWLSALGPVERDFNQKSLRQWKRAHPGHRSFTVVRHPLLRAHAAFCRLLETPAPELRSFIARVQKVEVPRPGQGYPDADAFRRGFLDFLGFLKLHVTGQTGLKLDAHLATQAAAIEGFSRFQTPDFILREDRLAGGLAWLAAERGLTCPPLPTADEYAVPLAAIHGPDLEEAAREAYARDYQGFGFGDWAAQAA